ncbi:DUF3224 domain-containing protein [Spirilliplanes yamanashiensis]|uniref:DUF3224 domain-containing protein n=1 Tax=Spirilliplanes yamanashiensis TaxID=42233 RepID=A0A8J3YBD5_9ACTN|nr:DUF3224 domain-containing protein [Spirilliplanes yamanashiensis]MDP9817835.1 hypothetical protein [Spirilliplanes yamanashiensis]GIJ04645.1 hypothetical protein Sya03_39970 [Spirilliplanes yamanashiensis]
MPEITAAFQITRWDQTPADNPADGPVAGPALARAQVDKTYTGDLAGTSVAHLVMAGEIAYSAVERVTGRLGGRTGTFVLAHGAVTGSGPADFSPGVVVPGTGTGELAGLTGTVEFRHDDAGARVVLRYELAPSE